MVIRIRLYDNDAKNPPHNGKSDKEIMDRLRLKKKFPSFPKTAVQNPLREIEYISGVQRVLKALL